MKQILMLMLLMVGLLFWGLSTDVLWLGFVLAALLLLGFLFKGKYDFEQSSFYQVANLAALIVAAIFTFYWLDTRASKAIMPTLQLLPLALLPLMLMQYLSKQGLLPSSALLFFQRGKSAPVMWFDVSVLFLFACLFSAGAVPHQGMLYFTGVSALLLAFLLISFHQKQTTANVWIVLVFLLAESLGLAFVYGLNDLQSRLEAKINNWILSYNDGNKSSTAIGALGRLKLSDNIVFRLHADKPLHMPMLLREATYQRYIQETWFGGAWKDKNVPIVGERWQLLDTDAPLRQLKVYQSFEDEKQTLALPAGSAALQHLAVDALRIRQGGRVEAQDLPPFAGFDVFYTGVLHINPTIARSDFEVPKAEAKTIAELAKKLNLYHIKYQQGEAAAIQAIHNYFNQHFTYSTWQSMQPQQQTPLSYFLSQSQAGHCEYFATATVLLLRELGIPARYAVGYSVSEYDKDAGLYVVRGRDAHAWAVAYVDNVWVNIDNTPPDWLMIEDEDAAMWQGLNDVLSSWLFALKKWRYTGEKQDTTLWYWLLAGMFIFLAYRALRRVKTKQAAPLGSSKNKDKTWSDLEQALAQAGYARKQGETVSAWLARIKHGQWQALAALYNNKYYAEHGLDNVQAQRFESFVQQIRQSLKEKLP
jgi:hypothetical protein